MTISLRDEAALTWYFLHGERAFQKSTHGAMVDRLIRDSMGSARCRVCGGCGILETEAAVKRAKRTGKTMERRRRWKVVEQHKPVDCGANYRDGGAVLAEEVVEEWVPVAIGAECMSCSGTGFHPRKRPLPTCPSCARIVTQVELEDGTPRIDREPLERWRERRRLCSDCRGSGHARETVRRTTTDHEDGGVEVAGDVLRAFALVNRRLLQIGGHRETLELYYGVEGQSWADQPGGRLIALEPLTEAGKRLLKRTKREGDEATGASPAERIAAQIDRQGRSPESWRRELLGDAEAAARGLHRLAVIAWNSTEDKGSISELERLKAAIRKTGERYENWLDRNWEAWWFDPCWDESDGPGVAA